MPSPHEELHSLGAFVVSWSVYDAVLEVGIIRELGVETLKGSIVTCQISTAHRAGILSALLKLRDEKHPAVNAIKDLTDMANRNAIHHSLMEVAPEPVTILRRRLDNGNYKTHRMDFTDGALKAHVLDTNRRIAELQSLLGISDTDISAFAYGSMLDSKPRQSPPQN